MLLTNVLPILYDFACLSTMLAINSSKLFGKESKYTVQKKHDSVYDACNFRALFTGETRLLPQGGETRQRVLYFRNLLDPIPANVITIGSIFHPRFVGTPRAPFIGPVRKSLAGGSIGYICMNQWTYVLQDWSNRWNLWYFECGKHTVDKIN